MHVSFDNMVLFTIFSFTFLLNKDLSLSIPGGADLNPVSFDS